MPKVEILCPDGRIAEVVGSTGMTLMEAIRASGVDKLLALCGEGAVMRHLPCLCPGRGQTGRPAADRHRRAGTA